MITTCTVRTAPTFEEMRRTAYRLLSSARWELSADWHPGTGPTCDQAAAAQEALRHIARALQCLDRARPVGPAPRDPVE